MMYGHEKSRSAIVAVKPTNNAERPAAEQSAVAPTAAEPVERRAETKGNVDQQSTRRTQRRISVSQLLAALIVLPGHLVHCQGPRKVADAVKW
jgi:hypothetical protein